MSNPSESAEAPDYTIHKGRLRTYEVREPKWKAAIAIFSELSKSVSRFTTTGPNGEVMFDSSGIPAVVMEIGGLGGFMAERMVTDLTEKQFNELPAGEAMGLMSAMVPLLFTPELLGNVARTVQNMKPAVSGAAIASARTGTIASGS